MGKPCPEKHATAAEQDACPLCPPVSDDAPESPAERQPSYNKPEPVSREDFDWRTAPSSTMSRHDTEPRTEDDTDWATALDRPAPTHAPQPGYGAAQPPHATYPASPPLPPAYPAYPPYAPYGYTLEPDTPYASIGSRFAAWLLDLIVWLTLAFVLAVLAENITGSTPSGTVTFWLSAVFYYVVPTAFTGRTLGKLACGIKVVRADDFTRPPGLGWSALRSLTFTAMSFVPLGQPIDAGVASTDTQRRMVHDRAARTRVIDIAAFARLTTPTPAYWPTQPPSPLPSPPQQYGGMGPHGYPANGGYPYPPPPPKKTNRTLIVLVALAVGLFALMWIAAIVQVSADQHANYHSVAKKDVEAIAAAEDAYHAATNGWWNGTIPAGSSQQIGAVSVTPSPGNAVSVQILAEGGYCIRVDDTDDPTHTSHFYSSLTREHSHAPCVGTPLAPNGTTPVPPPAPSPPSGQNVALTPRPSSNPIR
jgi:uncharacterized RDD family membrane protein YckC